MKTAHDKGHRPSSAATIRAGMFTATCGAFLMSGCGNGTTAVPQPTPAGAPHVGTTAAHREAADATTPRFAAPHIWFRYGLLR